MAIRNSRTGAALSGATGRLREIYAASSLANAVRATRDRSARIVAGSALADLVGWTETATRSSWLYQWFTAEPDPDVIVIDLRETAIVGSILGGIDRTVRWLADPWRRAESKSLLERTADAFVAAPIRFVSAVLLVGLGTELAMQFALSSIAGRAFGVRLLLLGLALAGTRIRLSLDQVAASRTARLLVALFEPPEPPEAVEAADHEDASGSTEWTENEETSE